RFLWADGMIRIPGRLRVCIRVERRFGERAPTRPEPAARALVGIGLDHHVIGTVRRAARMTRRRSAGESRRGQIEAPQKKWTGLALPRNWPRNRLSTRSAWTRMR